MWGERAKLPIENWWQINKLIESSHRSPWISLLSFNWSTIRIFTQLWKGHTRYSKYWKEFAINPHRRSPREKAFIEHPYALWAKFTLEEGYGKRLFGRFKPRPKAPAIAWHHAGKSRLFGAPHFDFELFTHAYWRNSQVNSVVDRPSFESLRTRASFWAS